MASMTKEELQQLKNLYMNNIMNTTSISSSPFSVTDPLGSYHTGTASNGISNANSTPGGYGIATTLSRDWYSNIQDSAAVTYRHTSHAPDSVYKTLESFGWTRHRQHGSDAELFTHKDHNGACLYWYEALIAQMSLAFIELNK